ncbi:MAG TPA: cupredoxin domain-containing protein [Candidatus Saccharimonadales bacterium]|nr:cupredoxin domain-containing protein [Candidatus Saccharimonadales bacterium]
MEENMQPYETPQGPYASNSTNEQRRTAKKWFIVVIVLVLLAAGGVAAYVLKSHNTTSQTAEAISTTVSTVTIQQGGFVPATIKVKKGQEITWTNQDSTPHHITADQSDLASFDTADPLQTGDSYTYIFDKTGTYHYYDVTDPKTYVGTIIVE